MLDADAMLWVAAIIFSVTIGLTIASATLSARRGRPGGDLRDEDVPECVRLKPPAWETEGHTDLTAPPANAATLAPPRGARLRHGLGAPAAAVREAVMDGVAEGLRRLPPLPRAVQQVFRELDAAGSTARSVSDIVATEPVLAAAVLRVVNSALYHLQRRIVRVDEAVAYLGFATVRTLVLRMKLGEALGTGRPAPAGGYDPEQLWLHSLAVAQVADHLARHAGGTEPALAGTIGLLHDIGKIAINGQFPHQVARLWDRSGSADASADESFLARERRVFGADHAFLGALVAARWELPEELVECIRLHHLPAGDESLARLPGEVRRALEVVHVANQLVKYAHVYCADMEIDIVSPELLTCLNLPPDLERLLTPDVRQIVERSAAMGRV